MIQTQAVSGVQVLTIHASKGLEFDHVRLPFWIEGVMPHGRAVDEGGNAVEEERRLAYVAVTRARKTVGVSASLSVRNCPFIRQSGAEQSRFVMEMAKNRTVEFLKKGDNPPPLYRSAGDPSRPAAPVRHAASTARTEPVPQRAVPAMDPIELMVGDLSRSPEISEEEFLSRTGPGWSEADLDKMHYPEPESDWEPVPF